MTTPDTRSTAALQPMLTPAILCRDFGARAPVARDGVRILYDALSAAPRETLAPWRSFFGRWAGRSIDRIPRHLAKLADRYGVSTADSRDVMLFALQTYYVILVELVASRLVGSRNDNFELLPDNPFCWYASMPSESVRRLIESLTEALDGYRVATSVCDSDDFDWFKPLYQEIFPRPLRRQLGEYYTPDWLARHVLDQVGYTGEPGQRLLDPACGSGTFLVAALRRLKEGERGNRGEWRVESGEYSALRLPPSPLSSLPSPLSSLPPITGFDLNPLAVITARANYLIAVADLLPDACPAEIPVYLCDSILGADVPVGNEAAFDYVVGNPPWIAWDNLPDEERQATKPLWQRYGLFSLSGNEARHGGGKKDLSALMLYATADRYLKPGGRLGMVITQTLFQSKGAGDGFRRFRLGPDGPPLGVLRVDDLVALRPFGDAANWTSTIVLQKGVATEYPVPYYKWSEGRGTGDGERAEGGGRRAEHCRLPTADCPLLHPPSVPCLARPINPARPNSPWLVLPNDVSAASVPNSSFLVHPSDYTAHLGANSGGANGVYWVEVLSRDEKGVRIRNMATRGKRTCPAVEHAIEPDLLYPLLRWSDVRRYAAVPRGFILLAQDPATRAGLSESVMRQQYPRTLDYLERFRELLSSRAAYRRYQQGGPFYSMYNVGPYTMAPIKVVWRRMDRQINAAVVEETDNPLLGRRPMLPQETCVLIACDSTDEAHYACAVLNSSTVNELVLASSVRGGKGFGTPGMLDFIPLRRFQYDDPRHLELATLSQQAHRVRTAASDETAMLAEIQLQIDRLAAATLR